MPQAAGLADAIKAKFGINPKLVEGHNGIFEVSFDKKVVYLNTNEGGRFPTNEEIFDLIKKYKGK
ncbi:MAG: Rdx family protein [Candidatus Zixiibacteriota bacterium]